ncbi:hypothetical protein BCU70_11335 [Vibrio sp. 10N.286.49.C2]|uniref:hypothetical protein n=1 Tax=unclassified Vibrio TaxID=2614977 RepID=UPI000C83368B|nr:MULTISPECIES: hypothetical protein [unclassified Vibrio]PMH40745.1 hypothetical protein BCU70_11335 [Vibrio sp. 10N.286.49.C2]PMH45276.1 hypothetical protein BCU66_02935 [Vibrio sp. 10N.286.49.B1]PMH83495.1 hypothetical protein BCU58_14595 [Vibrio sp. 10N.286.48.B7]
MDTLDYYVRLNKNGHANVYRDGHLLLGSEVIEIDHLHQVDNNLSSEATAIIQLANGNRMTDVKVHEE